MPVTPEAKTRMDSIIAIDAEVQALLDRRGREMKYLKLDLDVATEKDARAALEAYRAAPPAPDTVAYRCSTCAATWTAATVPPNLLHWHSASEPLAQIAAVAP